MTPEEKKQLWIKLLQPLADLAARREANARYPGLEEKLQEKAKQK